MHTRFNLLATTTLVLSLGAAGLACSSSEDDGGGGATGGTTATGGAKTGGAKTGGSATGGSATGGSTGGSATGGTSTGGSATGGSSTGGSATGGSATGGSASGGSDAGGGTDTGGSSDGPAVGAKMVLTVDHDTATSTPERLCFKKESANMFGDHSPKIDWTPPPAGTKSLVLMMEDLSNTTPHRIVCNMLPTETGMPADIKAMVPSMAQAGTGHGKTNDAWYGPGAGGAAHKYEFTIFALSTEKLAGGCGPGKGPALAARDYLKDPKNAAVILDKDSKTLWGNREGSCK